ncbi:MAG: sodium:solute symporter family protein [Rhodothermales bacterium]
MITWLWILGSVYAALLCLAAYVSWKRTKTADDYVLAGSNLGALVGLLTYAATLFSTFTLMGMPDFFRTHGVGAWIFLAVSDGAQVVLIIWFGYHLRKRARARGFRGTAGLLGSLYDDKWAGYTYFGGVFLFLIPYVAIQIRGLAIFLEAIFPEALPAWIWSAGILAVMLLYSEIGGLRAIIYSDILQGLTLLLVVWIVAVSSIMQFGGVGELFAAAEAVDRQLLSTPGPQGLFTVQFLVASFFGVLLLPATQPQLTTRLIVIRNRKELNRMAVSIGCFAIVILIPVAAIGMYGAVRYPEATTREFLANVLLFEQSGIVGAACVVGLLTAAMSTADSQIFALGTELRSLLSGETTAVLKQTKRAILGFGLVALIFSVVSSDQLVLLARVSFNGTALVGPMVIAGVICRRAPGREVVVATAVGLILFILSLVGLVPSLVGPARLDLLLLVLLGIITAVSSVIHNRRTA